MDITIKNKPEPETTIGDIKSGDTFIDPNAAHRGVMMLLDEKSEQHRQATGLAGGIIWLYADDEEITEVNVKAEVTYK